MSNSYPALMEFVRDTAALGQVSGLLGWDQETMMPRGAASQRGAWMGAMEKVLHQRQSDPRIGDWLAGLEGQELGEVETAHLREIRRAYDRATKVPEALAAELAETTSVSQGIWAEARANEDFAAFAPSLEKVLELRRAEAACLAGDADPYDALLQDYEPGMNGGVLAEMLGSLRDGLVDLRDRIKGSAVLVPELSGDFPGRGSNGAGA